MVDSKKLKVKEIKRIRSKMEIRGDILIAINNHKDLTIWNLVTKCNTNGNTFKTKVSELIQKGLVKRYKVYAPHRFTTKQKFRLTEKGMKILKLYRKLESELKDKDNL